MDLTQIVQRESDSDEEFRSHTAGRRIAGDRTGTYTFVLAVSFYLIAAMFVPVLRFWEGIPGLKTFESSVSPAENLKRADEIFNPPPVEKLRMPAADLTDFVFSPDGHYLILLYNDLEKRRSRIQIKEVSRADSKEWKVWREFDYEFQILKIGAFQDRIAVFMQESANTTFVSNFTLPDNDRKFSAGDYSERTFFYVFDYNGQKRAQEILPGKYLQSFFSENQAFVQTSRAAFILQSEGDTVFKVTVPATEAGIKECRSAEIGFICLTSTGNGLNWLRISKGAAEILPAVVSGGRILYFEVFADRIFYYTANNLLTIRRGQQETVFPKKFNAVNLIAVKYYQGKEYLAVYADARLYLALFTLDGGIEILHDESVDYPLSELIFYPGADRFLLAANQAGADYMQGDLRIFVFNLSTDPPNSSNVNQNQ